MILPTDGLSERAKKALDIALHRKLPTREAVARLSRFDFIIQKGVFTKTANELVAWADGHGIKLPDHRDARNDHYGDKEKGK